MILPHYNVHASGTFNATKFQGHTLSDVSFDRNLRRSHGRHICIFDDRKLESTNVGCLLVAYHVSFFRNLLGERHRHNDIPQ
jgi:hypothetical protein